MEQLTIQNIAKMTDWISVKRTFESWNMDKIDEMYGAFVYLTFVGVKETDATLLFLDSGLEKEFPNVPITLIQKYDLAFTIQDGHSAFDVEEWSDIASIKVDSNSLSFLRAEELIALVVYEMTFYAFSIEELRIFWSLLQSRIESTIEYKM